MTTGETEPVVKAIHFNLKMKFISIFLLCKSMEKTKNKKG